MSKEKLELKDVAARKLGEAFWGAVGEEFEKHMYSKPSDKKEAFRIVALEMAKHASEGELLAIESFSGYNLRNLFPEEHVLGREEFEHYMENPDHPDHKKPTPSELDRPKH